MNDDIKRSIGLSVKTARQQRGMTQAQLAEVIDKSFEAISNIERGKTAPSFTTLADISKALGLPIRDFFAEEAVGVADQRRQLLVRLNTLVSQMDSDTLRLFVEVGSVIQAEHEPG